MTAILLVGSGASISGIAPDVLMRPIQKRVQRPHTRLSSLASAGLEVLTGVILCGRSSNFSANELFSAALGGSWVFMAIGHHRFLQE